MRANAFEVPVTEEPPTLRAGNANVRCIFRWATQTYGPAGTGPEVVKGVVLAAEQVTEWLFCRGP